MRVFLRFSDAQLFFPSGAHDLSQDFAKLLLRKNERRRKAHVVLCEAHKMHLRPHLTIKAVEIFQQKGLR
jgi:hypothetical protein